MGRGLQLYSGRVIALGRLMLATLFMGALMIDVSQPVQAPTQTYELLLAYQLFAAGIAFVTWNNWWLDAKLAGPAHAVDIALFTILVFMTEGYTSPFFVFFVFLLLSAAIRWGWKETTLTAILVAILYLVAGNLAASTDTRFAFYRFIVRAGHLVILSLILIWFGIHQWRARGPSPAEELLAEPRLERSPIETGLAAAMAALGAKHGAFLWFEEGRPAKCFAQSGEIPTNCAACSDLSVAPAPFLYDFDNDRSLSRDSERNLVARSPKDSLDRAICPAITLRKGLAVPVRTGAGLGQMFLDGIPSLSTDHLDLGAQLGADVAAHIQRHALMAAAAESAEARSRIVLARDLHDSVVQFLAGAAFRLEAMKRSAASGRALEPELNELKQLMLQEQGELRAFITALRSGSQIPFADFARDLQALGSRLSRQWDIECEVLAAPSDQAVSTDLHLNAHQLIREAVANAVRHAGAKSVRVGLSTTADAVQLDLVNDGAAYPMHGTRIYLPQTMHERVEQAGGAIDLSRGMKVTKLSISLPIRRQRA